MCLYSIGDATRTVLLPIAFSLTAASALRDRIVARAEYKLSADWLHLHWPTAGDGHGNLGWL